MPAVDCPKLASNAALSRLGRLTGKTVEVSSALAWLIGDPDLHGRFLAVRPCVVRDQF
jgi:hypothetical protein